ncbi:hypothetical protein GUJ93_ZPchr0009g2067 [Zizania palustris]|uniref:Uncharacterized protein n=1 Tax=Zizania palustris TaxID=103762 RepID=A0A8J5RL53_ZIZPA|nr:hypothetical protein GUJ93_ZPchr0009g2067 [Zizania palustris]
MGKNVSNAKTFLEKRYEGQISVNNIEIGIIRSHREFNAGRYIYNKLAKQFCGKCPLKVPYLSGWNSISGKALRQD